MSSKVNITRFFVTIVVLFATFLAVSCKDKRDKRQSDPIAKAALKIEVNTKWEESSALAQELSQNFRILILDHTYRTPTGTWVSSSLMGEKFNWSRLTLAERQVAKEKLAQFVTTVSALVAIDAKRRVVVTNMDKVRSRYEGGLAFQHSLTMFEKVVGEQYEPKAPGQAPIYFSPVDI